MHLKLEKRIYSFSKRRIRKKIILELLIDIGFLQITKLGSLWYDMSIVVRYEPIGSSQWGRIYLPTVQTYDILIIYVIYLSVK